MAVPRSRLSNARKNKRRSHHAKKPKQLSQCSNCNSPALPHTLCTKCGFYDGRVVIHGKEE
ncbi:MAG: 50S ribosomal protein L32 [Chlamydiae bacterium]|nr:50S ribosomal protein L32 [Chlamydiota bacterium]